MPLPPPVSAVPPAAATTPWPYPLTRWSRPEHYKDKFAANPLVKENRFIGVMPDRSFPPTFAEARGSLPEPFWDGHESAVAGYWRAWELAFRNCKRAPIETGFIRPFIDTAFNDCLFMWDSVFILMFARYGERAFHFQQTLDNFYAKQHPSGYICREIRQWSGEDFFHYSDPNGTGPNTLHWSEWEYYQQFGDRERLEAIFPILLAYHQWMKRHRSWQDGTYWTTGWGSGMDNQSRLSPGSNPKWDHDHLSWIDATAQALFSARTLVRMARALGREAEAPALEAEIDLLTRRLNETMWNEEIGFYADRRADGTVSHVKTIGAYWTFLAEAATPERRARMIAHLEDPKMFARPHRIPSLSADDPHYEGEKGGSYWLGAVWPPTNYMVLRGLTAAGEDDLAYRIGRNHHENVTKVFETTGTYWENYSPEKAERGNHAMKDFLGWGGVGPIAVFLEYVLGLRPDFSRQTLVWDVRLTEAHGVKNYPIGRDTALDLRAEARAKDTDEPRVTITANRPVRVELRWPGGGRREIQVNP